MREKTVLFSSFEDFYKQYQPVTPYGRRNRENREWFKKGNDLTRNFDLLQHTVDFIRGTEKPALDRILYHLKSIPMLPSFDTDCFYSADIFLIRKFLLHYEAIARRLPHPFARVMNIRFTSEKLLTLLDPEQKREERFALYESFSSELADIRASIRKLDGELKILRKAALQQIAEKLHLDFSFCEFLFIPAEKALHFEQNLVFIEPSDEHNVIVKPVMPEAFFHLHTQRDRLLQQERMAEKKVLETLTREIMKKKKALAKYEKAMENIDTFIARARLAEKHQCTRPRLSQWGAPLQIKNGRFLPLVAQCKKTSLEYQPLTVNFSTRVSVIHGSNMGGKTVVLRSIAFFQLLTQYGFFVPADSFQTVLFDRIHVIGAEVKPTLAGLSSFGLEIHEWVSSSKKQQPSLYLVDEFARTTNSREARAIVAAMIHDFCENIRAYVLLSTHMVELPDNENCRYFRMKGLNHQEYRKQMNRAEAENLSERLRRINYFMQYEVVPDREKRPVTDALAIARMLGVKVSIIRYAKNILEGKNET